MSNVIKATAISTGEALKVLLGVATQGLVLGTTSMNALKESSTYIEDLANGTVSHAVSSERALRANATIIQKAKDITNMTGVTESVARESRNLAAQLNVIVARDKKYEDMTPTEKRAHTRALNKAKASK